MKTKQLVGIAFVILTEVFSVYASDSTLSDTGGWLPLPSDEELRKQGFLFEQAELPKGKAARVEEAAACKQSVLCADVKKSLNALREATARLQKKPYDSLPKVEKQRFRKLAGLCAIEGSAPVQAQSQSEEPAKEKQPKRRRKAPQILDL